MRVNRLLGILIFVASILLAWGWMEYDGFVNKSLNLPEEGVNYILHPGMTVRSLAEDLQQRGMLEKPILLRFIARWQGQASKLKAGEYYLPAGTTPPKLLEILSSSQVVQYALTIIEGWTFDQLMAAIRRDPVLEHSLKEVTNDQVMQHLGLDDLHPEGRFYPDTYHFPRGTTDAAFLKRAYKRMESVLEQAWQQRKKQLPLKSPYEALILASIIERETGIPEERGKIAGVFIRRLKRGMLLQTDPTVIYGMGESYNGNIRKRDLTRDTPYNTYLHKGLTPTPIAMPSGAAIRAALNPEEGNSLYFVATGDGGHYFSSTLEEHNKAVRKYQLKR
ncbi:MAG: endolytic transglycosylase MltG [Candidatus Thiodiazotropha endolucinida]|uniref:Endolytic murein transglycosylase n=2 Tax=Candidatus Thiodiazotropha TaxID=1913444 RepID=A0A7Z0VJ21_9GAMM|nr:endolytic transglycosylase MltG [Candidatus Thiodiazotropha endolucinida]MBT3040401.1 endolytic transglycosylase MltG [Candidatus Thiodiazotropha sp. (ex Codakia orbicularis)]MBT3092955.1 endolytic transglycosylase MltG [Candidatus Thiodiazotropha sp. (ex Lucina pensylvanica)]MBV2126139.1 endolytic transglycosylase MltG [Candidatus Thiodiazotropha taylori]MBT3043692.1 endolytic transglycosylase MltG [Candidatus Thiodiazotropha sp. (ex Codakia orbicularis)]MCG7860986.1 endolytic transglycosy